MRTKEEICEKALELFKKRGYDNTPMSLVARTLGLSKAGLYYHFPTKESLLYHISEFLMEERFAPILEKAKRISDPEERIAYFIKDYTKLLAEDDNARVVLHDCRRLTPGHYKKIRSIWRNTFDLVRDAVSEMQRSGKARKLNRAFAAFAAIGMCSWTFYWFDYSRRESADELSETFSDIFLKAILKEK